MRRSHRDVLPWPSWSGEARCEPGRLDVFAFRLESSPEAVTAADLVLTSDERQRADRFRFSADRVRYVHGRYMLRQVLARFVGAEPAELRFGYGAHGRPELRGRHDRVRFNLAHSGDLAVLAVSGCPAVGVDVEAIGAFDDLEDLALRCFAGAEHRAYRSVPASQSRRSFFLGWTRKEAFIKATGEGLSRPLDSFEVELRPDAPVRFLRLPAERQTENWSLIHLEPAPGFVAAAAVHTASATEIPGVRAWSLQEFPAR